MSAADEGARGCDGPLAGGPLGVLAIWVFGGDGFGGRSWQRGGWQGGVASTEEARRSLWPKATATTCGQMRRRTLKAAGCRLQAAGDAQRLLPRLRREAMAMARAQWTHESKAHVACVAAAAAGHRGARWPSVTLLALMCTACDHLEQAPHCHRPLPLPLRATATVLTPRVLCSLCLSPNTLASVHRLLLLLLLLLLRLLRSSASSSAFSSSSSSAFCAPPPPPPPSPPRPPPLCLPRLCLPTSSFQPRSALLSSSCQPRPLPLSPRPLDDH